MQHWDAVQPCLCTTVALGLAFRIWWGLFSTFFIGKAIGTLAVPRKLHNSTGRTILHARIPTIVTIGVCSRYSPRKRLKNALYKGGIVKDFRELVFIVSRSPMTLSNYFQMFLHVPGWCNGAYHRPYCTVNNTSCWDRLNEADALRHSMCTRIAHCWRGRNRFAGEMPIKAPWSSDRACWSFSKTI